MQIQHRHARAAIIGAIMELVTSRRGIYVKTEYLDESACC